MREEPLERRDIILQEIERLRGTMSNVCDTAMLRVKFLPAGLHGERRKSQNPGDPQSEPAINAGPKTREQGEASC